MAIQQVVLRSKRRAHTRQHALPAPVQAAANRFEIWRKDKRGRERIPEPLWAAAVKLCKTHSAHKVARWLRLNSTALRQRLSAKPLKGRATDAANAFVEWAAPLPLPAPRAEYVLELEGGNSPNLRLRIYGAKVPEVARLANLLRKGQR